MSPKHAASKKGKRHEMHLKLEELKEIPKCKEEYSCDAQRTRSLGDYARKHIAAESSVPELVSRCHVFGVSYIVT